MAGCRTAFQRAGTGFAHETAVGLAAATIRGLLTRTGIPGPAVDRVVFGHILTRPEATNVAREAAFDAGLPSSVPALSLTAAGVSASQAVSHGIDAIRTGRADVVLAGGTDCISDPPIGYRRSTRNKLLAGRKVRGISRLRWLAGLRPRDFLPEPLDIRERTTGQSMGGWSEALAREMAIDREAQDRLALRSHRAAAAARRLLAEEIVPVETGRGTVERDNGIRPDTTYEALAHLRPSFAEDGTITPGNASFLTDGAAAVLLASRSAATRLGLPLAAVFRADVLTAHDPRTQLLLGPAFALPRALDEAGIALGDLDVVELHEAFAAQVLAVQTLGRPGLRARRARP